ncbi:MAG: nicotinate (nicotinamide) nucleotide adenylyltransferase [Fimbriimonadaceae bacterium]|nr:nicotinate (nicotinamide) nucleotide adenylyltransferase [Fimbriimonadaceae bacterium]QYK59388.1 MAG: nicotinate (nicotinamide) nucleotide adenylyltransferase [Fimbriimonadaceae bacterium]
MKYGVLGGSFDPPHVGHLALARAAHTGLGLDETILVPAARNPLKHRRTSPARHRLKMTLLAIQDEPGLSVSDIEVTRGEPSYTVETLEELTRARPGDYWLIIGADAARTFMQWKEPERISHLARIAVAARDGASAEEATKDWPDDVRRRTDFVTLAPVDTSSSIIRELARRGKPLDAWLKPTVLAYILEQALYEE